MNKILKEQNCLFQKRKKNEVYKLVSFFFNALEKKAILLEFALI
jgi:hypothetical protein